MKSLYLVAGLFLAAPSLAAETVRLPPDVTSFIERDRQTVACQPKPSEGLSPQEIIQNYIAIRASNACADLERERRALVERYKDNKDVINALKLKIGFVGTDRYVP